MPLFIKLMVLEWTDIEVSLMIALAVDIFEGMRARLALFGLEM